MTWGRGRVKSCCERWRGSPELAPRGRDNSGWSARSLPRDRSVAGIAQAPAFFDAADTPDCNCERPGEREQARDEVAEGVDVYPRHPVPEVTVQPQLAGSKPEQLDGADHERHR